VKCDKIRTQLQDYLDNRLVAKQQAQVERHLAACPDCRAELAFLKTYQANLAVGAPQAAPPDLLAKIRQQLSSAELSHKKVCLKTFRPLPVLFPGLAGTVVLAVLVVCLFKPWDFSLNEKVTVNEPVSQTAGPATATGDKSAGTLQQSLKPARKAETMAGREADQKSVASAVPTTDESAGTLQQSLKPAGPAREAEAMAGREADQKSVALTVPATDKSVGTLQKSIMPSQKVKIPEEPVIAVLIPVKKALRTKSVGDELDERRADDIVMRLKTLLKRIDGIIIREEGDDRKLPLMMNVAVTFDNYPRLIVGLKELGEVKEPALSTALFNDDLRLNLKIDYQTGEN
jgi:anti-sigma factor RsiW